MDHGVLEDLLSSVEVRLSAFAVCEIAADARLQVGPLESLICHFVARGHGFLEYAGKRVPIEAGSIIMVPPHTAKSISGPHPVTRDFEAVDSCYSHGDGLLKFGASAEQPTLILGCASMTADCAESFGLLDGLVEPAVLTVAGNGLFAASFEALLDELLHPDVGSVVIAECLMKQALVLLFRQHLDMGSASPLAALLGDPRLVRAVSAMLKNPGAPHTIDSMAEVAGMSRSAFMSKFTEEHGQTPGAFLQTVRMHSAARLLRSSDMPVKCLAAAVGYASRSQFSRVFKQTFGLDPTRYRCHDVPVPAERSPELTSAFHF
jgi:AraC-like DNA-binding protein